MTERPDVSIVIPTRDRWPALRRTLAVIGEQALDGIAAEVVVVDNGSLDGSRERTADAIDAGELNVDVRLYDELVPGAAAARNTGIRAAAADVVLFLGDDTRPASTRFVAEHLRSHAEADGPLAVVGRVVWDPGKPVSPVMAWLDRTGKAFDFERALHEPPGPYLFYTSNASVTRAALVAVDGFDERFPTAAWEDHEIALRMQAAGTRLAFRPELIVHHEHAYRLRDSLRRMEGVGRSGDLLNRLHPDESPAPKPRGAKGWAGRWLAPVAMRIELPTATPTRVGGAWFRVAHFAALARGQGGEPLADDPSLRGGIRRPPAPGERPAISVVTPFYGDQAEARALLARLSTIERREGDEVIVADNSEAGVVGPAAQGTGVRVVSATYEGSPAHARNAGAAHARCEWLIFLDADCRPSRGLLDAYFAQPVDEDAGALAGRIIDVGNAATRLGRYVLSRARLDQARYLGHPYLPFAVTANLLVRRAVWEQVGGLLEGAMSGEDTDFCWRLQHAGWRLGYRANAVVEHTNRDELRALLRQQVGYASGRAWLQRRHPGSEPPPRHATRIARNTVRALQWTLAGRFERAALRAIDVAVLLADYYGYQRENRARPRGDREPGAEGAVVLVEHGPAADQPLGTDAADAFAGLGAVRVEARRRADTPDTDAARRRPIAYWEDDGFATRFRDALWLRVRHPVRSVGDRRTSGKALAPATLAPCVRRCKRSGARELVVPAGDPAQSFAGRVARLSGLPLRVVDRDPPA
jgi:GT2 family glycosyltransferase